MDINLEGFIMELLLRRIALKSTHTIGKLYIDGHYFCDTLEDPNRDHDRSGKFEGDEKKIYGNTAIPFGRYKINVVRSPRFKRELPLLLDVPHFTGILIHRGNTVSDTHGCILVGENKAVGKVLNSTPYEVKLVEIMKAAQAKGEEITITIV